jgi:hypothetical protein
LIIVNINGGLGNQLFQYAYAKSLQQKGYEVKIDKDSTFLYGYFLDRFLIDIEMATEEELSQYKFSNIMTKLKRKIGLTNHNFIKEPKLSFSNKLLSPKNNSYIQGYFQSEKYFFQIRDTLLSQISLKKSLSSYGINIQKKISACNISCSIHIRRSDYLSSTAANKVHGTLDINYYKKSIKLLEKRFSKNIHFFLFSDDVDWVIDNLKIKNSTYIVDDFNRDPNEDMFLMSLCNHHIIANSTFGWWGAWLNTNPNKMVVAPRRWFLDEKLHRESVDILCNDWVKI